MTCAAICGMPSLMVHLKDTYCSLVVEHKLWLVAKLFGFIMYPFSCLLLSPSQITCRFDFSKYIPRHLYIYLCLGA
jgi:hypothetical protein